MAEGTTTSANEMAIPTSPTTGDKPGISKVIQKRYSRTVEKMLQSFGRTDKTTDEDFDRLVETFTEHQATASRLSLELKNYIKQARTLSAASTSMQQAIKDAYDQKWIDSLLFSESSEKIAEKWNNYMVRLEEAQTHLTHYVERFQELKQKISKRSRKMTDYDSARHTVQSLENSKKKDSFKVTKAQEDMATAKFVYESMNRELQRELQELHESRAQRICTYLSKLYIAEAEFLEETSKLKRQLAEAAAAAASVETESRGRPVSDYVYHYDGQPNSQNRSSNYQSEVTNGSLPRADYGAIGSNPSYETVDVRENVRISNADGDKLASPASAHSASSVSSERNVDDVARPAAAAAAVAVSNGLEPRFKASPMNTRGLSTESAESSDSEPLRNSDPVSAAAVEQQQSVISSDDYDDSRRQRKTPYKVVAVYDYEACDADELTLKAGEVITIIDFDDPEEQDPGWLMGVKESTGEKGIVPENFTKKF